ncbi:glycosyltransferase [Halorubrum sp. SS5]|nr:glycosyltransferase [Halorubrum sp. SS5]
MQSSDRPLDQLTVFYICSSDISKVQGNTEHYHVATYLDNTTETHLFGPFQETSKWLHTHRHPFDGIFGVILLNLFYLPYWGYMSLRYDPDVVYCYQNVILPPFLVRLFAGTTVVYDIQSGPVSQATEFSDREDRGIIFSLLNIFNFYGHQFALRRSDAIVTLSEDLEALLCRSYGLVPKDITVVPLGVNTDRFVPSKAQSDRIRLVYLGTASATRGLETVVDALDSLSSDVQSRVRFEIYGDGDVSYIERLQPRPDSQWEFIWHGYIDYEDIPKIVSQYDIAISPLPEYESYEVSSPAKIFEYLAMGLPIIATNITAHERILQAEEDSIFIDANDTTEMAVAIERLACNDHLREEMGAQARMNAMEHDWEKRFELIRKTIEDADQV